MGCETGQCHVLLSSQCSASSTERPEPVKGPKAPDNSPTARLFPSSVSPVLNASLTGVGSVPWLYWLGIKLHMDILNNRVLPLS